MINLHPILMIVTIKVNVLRTPMKKAEIVDWGGETKARPNICCLQETYFECKVIYNSLK